MTVEDRLTELELHFMEQQELLQQLSDVVYAQQRTIELLQSELAMTKRKLEAEPGMVDASQAERPPHY